MTSITAPHAPTFLDLLTLHGIAKALARAIFAPPSTSGFGGGPPLLSRLCKTCRLAYYRLVEYLFDAVTIRIESRVFGEMHMWRPWLFNFTSQLDVVSNSPRPVPAQKSFEVLELISLMPNLCSARIPQLTISKEHTLATLTQMFEDSLHLTHLSLTAERYESEILTAALPELRSVSIAVSGFDAPPAKSMQQHPGPTSGGIAVRTGSSTSQTPRAAATLTSKRPGTRTQAVVRRSQKSARQPRGPSSSSKGKAAAAEPPQAHPSHRVESVSVVYLGGHVMEEYDVARSFPNVTALTFRAEHSVHCDDILTLMDGQYAHVQSLTYYLGRHEGCSCTPEYDRWPEVAPNSLAGWTEPAPASSAPDIGGSSAIVPSTSTETTASTTANMTPSTSTFSDLTVLTPSTSTAAGMMPSTTFTSVSTGMVPSATTVPSSILALLASPCHPAGCAPPPSDHSSSGSSSTPPMSNPEAWVPVRFVIIQSQHLHIGPHGSHWPDGTIVANSVKSEVEVEFEAGRTDAAAMPAPTPTATPDVGPDASTNVKTALELRWHLWVNTTIQHLAGASREVARVRWLSRDYHGPHYCGPQTRDEDAIGPASSQSGATSAVVPLS